MSPKAGFRPVIPTLYRRPRAVAHVRGISPPSRYFVSVPQRAFAVFRSRAGAYHRGVWKRGSRSCVAPCTVPAPRMRGRAYGCRPRCGRRLTSRRLAKGTMALGSSRVDRRSGKHARRASWPGCPRRLLVPMGMGDARRACVPCLTVPMGKRDAVRTVWPGWNNGEDAEL